MHENCRILLAIVGLSLLLVGQTQTEESRPTLRPGARPINAVTVDLQASGDDDDYDDDDDVIVSGDGANETKDEHLTTGDVEFVDEDDDDDSDDGSGNGAIMVVTTQSSVSPCQRKLEAASSKPLIGSYRPQCMADGEYRPKQCHASTGHCWCVDEHGTEVDETRHRAPDSALLQCLANGEFVLLDPPTTRPKQRTTTTPEGDLHFADQTTPVSVHINRKTEKKGHHTTTESPDDCVGDACFETDIRDPEHSKLERTLLSYPWILAAIIGGAVLALICIVLLIMFTIYRMRKKDEGSYALNEPKKYHNGYTKAKNEEFFA